MSSVGPNEPSIGLPADVRPRWRRIVRHLAIVASCLPFAVVIMIWVRAQFVGDRVVWYGDRSVLLLATSPRGLAVGADVGRWSGLPRPNGRLSQERGRPDAFAAEMTAVFALNVGPGDTLLYGSRAGVAWFRYMPKYGGYSINRFSAPAWMLALFAAMPPLAWWAIRILQNHGLRGRQARGLCRFCGYDLRGSVGRCPECGTVIAVSRASKEADNDFAAPPGRPDAATLLKRAGDGNRGGIG